MKIVVIDYRVERTIRRANAIKKAIMGTFQDPRIEIDTYLEVNGKNEIGIWNGNEWRTFWSNINPDLILLHVSNEQKFSAECLQPIFEKQIVVCYTGNDTPEQVKTDCSNNKKHCYYPNRTTFNQSFDSPDLWKKSPEGLAILKFIEQLLEIYPNNTDNHGDIDEERFRKIKNILQNLDTNLEDVLDNLASELQEMLAKNSVIPDGIGVLAKSRDEKLAAAQIK